MCVCVCVRVIRDTYSWIIPQEMKISPKIRILKMKIHNVSIRSSQSSKLEASPSFSAYRDLAERYKLHFFSRRAIFVAAPASRARKFPCRDIFIY